MIVVAMFGCLAAAAEKTTVTGVVGDAMCGVKHMMGGDDPGCTRECVKQGSDYALIADGKALTLKAKSESTKAQLDTLAGKKANVTGERDGNTITVAAVEEAK
jgi:hypothetical protein